MHDYIKRLDSSKEISRIAHPEKMFETYTDKKHRRIKTNAK